MDILYDYRRIHDLGSNGYDQKNQVEHKKEQRLGLNWREGQQARKNMAKAPKE